MQGIYVSHKLLVGLLTYVNQAELSLDRLDLNARQELAAFYNNTVFYPVSKVVKCLEAMLGSRDTSTPTTWETWERVLTSWHYIVLSACSSFLSWHFVGGAYIPKAQLDFVLCALRQFDRVVQCPDCYEVRELKDVRLNLSYAALVIRRKIPSCRLTCEARAVMHLNSAVHLKLLNVEDIAGNAWLNSTRVS